MSENVKFLVWKEMKGNAVKMKMKYREDEDGVDKKPVKTQEWRNEGGDGG